MLSALERRNDLAKPGGVVDPILNIYRILCTVAALLIVTCGLIIQATSPTKIDPLEYRIAVAAAILGFVGLTYVRRDAKRTIYLSLHAIGYITAFWWLYVTYLNHFSPDECIGLIVTLVLVDLVFRTARAMTLFQAILMTSTGILALQVPDPQVSLPLLMLSLLCLSVLSYAFCRYSGGVEKALRESEGRYRSLFESQGEGIALIDRAGRFVLANPAAHLIFGVGQGALVGRRLKDFRAARVPSSDRLHLELGAGGFGDDAERRNVYELEIVQPSGDRRSLLVTATPRRDGDDRLTGSFVIIRDVTEQQLAESKLRYLSFHDALTGLYNRAYFTEEISRLNGGRSYPVTVVVVDVDGLKVVNDRQGHARGDELLKGCAGVLTASFRQGDVIARVGGDEFAIILPRTDCRAAESVCGRIEHQVAIFNSEHPELALSISHGRSTSHGVDDSLESAFVLADQDMYRQKLSRKANRDQRVFTALSTVPAALDFECEGTDRGE